MADIELVIKIDEEYLKDIKGCVNYGGIDYHPWVAIANGTPLEQIRAEIEKERVDVHTTAFKDEYNNLYDAGRHNGLLKAIEIIDKYAEQEPKTGHWIEHPEIETSTPEYLMFYECSECGDKQCFYRTDIHKKRFCSNCGCRMVEPRESEDKE